MTPLDFTLPRFCRVAWVSEKARTTWEPVLQRVAAARARLSHPAAPPCCESRRGDDTFARAMRTDGADVAERTVRLAGCTLLNTLWSPLDIRAVPHEPCSMTCEPSQRMAASWMASAREQGLAEEMDALEEILSWPVEWSALHGVAQIRTPILKISTNAGATAEAYTVQLVSDRRPPEALPGLHFPHRAPTGARSMSRPAGPPVQRDLPSPTATAALAPRPRSSAILDETFQRVAGRHAGSLPAIRSIYLSNYFNVVQLEDSSVGAAMNYCRFKSEQAVQHTLGSLTARLPSDPLLLAYLFDGQEPDLLQLSLKTCLVSALSTKSLREPNGFEAQPFDAGFFPDARSAAIVGFGGYMDYVILRTDTKQVHVSDLSYHRDRARMDRRLAYYRKLHPGKTITISDGSDNEERLARADLVSITGSAFCTGTMEGLLTAARQATTLIVQGQSAAIDPQVLFDRGVTLVSTSIKPEELMDVARTDEEQFRALLEGKLPMTHVRPASSPRP